jgi:hypothetical protein
MDRPVMQQDQRREARFREGVQVSVVPAAVPFACRQLDGGSVVGDNRRPCNPKLSNREMTRDELRSR